EADTGVKSGEQVILNPPVNLVDGGKVQIRSDATAPATGRLRLVRPRLPAQMIVDDSVRRPQSEAVLIANETILQPAARSVARPVPNFSLLGPNARLVATD
ncbi:hypothetical protein, partial [Roseiarcus sp.]|uniref:hypothetical protein n=1 Tax=Roseiarcus sp. TaxID=1969460 RepID=UPI003D0CA4B6